MSAIQLGPFVLQVPYLIIVVSLLTSFVILNVIHRKNYELRKALSNLFVNAVMIIFITWKFSPVLTSPRKVINEPISILFEYGTSIHILLGVCFAIIYLTYSSRKQGIPVPLLLDSFPYMCVGFLAVYHLLTLKPIVFYLPENYVVSFVYVFVFVLLWKIRGEIGSLRPLFKFFLLLGLANLALSFFATQNDDLLGISYAQLIFILFITIGLLQPKRTPHID